MAGPGALIAHRYWLLGRRAADRTGEVWQACDLTVGRRVTVRLSRPADPADVQRFLATARRAARLRHSGIVRICDYGRSGADGSAFLVTEPADGCSLDTVLHAVPLEPAWVLLVIRQVASALDAAHALGLVHRAVSPRNLLLAPGGTVRLTDFASSQPVDPQPGCSRYSAPERASATPAGDLYSLGVVAWECLTGRSLPAVLTDLGMPVPRLPALVGADLAALVADLTAVDPAARPASATQVAERAAELLAVPMRSGDPLDPAESFPAAEPRPRRLAGHAERLADSRPPSRLKAKSA